MPIGRRQLGPLQKELLEDMQLRGRTEWWTAEQVSGWYGIPYGEASRLLEGLEKRGVLERGTVELPRRGMEPGFRLYIDVTEILIVELGGIPARWWTSYDATVLTSAASKKGKISLADEVIARLHGAHKTPSEIAQICEIDEERVVSALKRMRLRRKGTSRSTVPEEALRDLHALGWSDVQISEELGISRGSIVKARQRLELPSNRQRGGQIGNTPPQRRDELRPQVEELHARGLNDKEIAEALGVHYNTAAKIRRVELGLPANR